jgi:hypothetical protein
LGEAYFKPAIIIVTDPVTHKTTSILVEDHQIKGVVLSNQVVEPNQLPTITTETIIEAYVVTVDENYNPIVRNLIDSTYSLPQNQDSGSEQPVPITDLNFEKVFEQSNGIEKL